MFALILVGLIRNYLFVSIVSCGSVPSHGLVLACAGTFGSALPFDIPGSFASPGLFAGRLLLLGRYLPFVFLGRVEQRKEGKGGMIQGENVNGKGIRNTYRN